jgi:DNA helicase II / ATP-dependent DNA helicase PcrA
MSILEGLNTEQRQAVEQLEGPLLVLAGAGSGKTRVLTHRIANLIQSGVRPWQILAVTFTNKAAEEMRHRIRALVGDDAQDLWISTFHSACLRMLRRDIEVLGIGRNFNVFDTDDQKRLMRSVIREKGLVLKEHPPRIYLSHIDGAKNAARTEEELREFLDAEHGKLSAALFTRYSTLLRKNNALDFNDLINLTVLAWKHHPQTLLRRQDQFRYLLVDEYQDTSPAQYEFVRLLAARSRNVMVVGDDDQSIYGFRGADIRNIFRFQEDFPSVQVIRLERNYRSHGNILDAANAVISKNLGRMEKRMWTSDPAGAKISILRARNQWDEAEQIQRTIDSLVRRGHRYEDFAIIYRTNASSVAFEQIFRRAELPHVLVGARKFYERKEIRDILSYFRLLVNPADEMSFDRAIGAPRRGVGDKTVQQITAIARRDGIDVLDAAKGWAEDGKAKIRRATMAFCQLVEELRTAARRRAAPHLLCEMILDRSGYRAALESEAEKERGKSGGRTDADRRLDNLSSLVDDLSRAWEELAFGDAGEDPLAWLQDFLDRAALASPTEDVPAKDQSSVTLMTAHLAKGLEFPVVFVAGMNEGTFPHFRSMELQEDIEEERRVVYVAMTRAERRLYLSYSRYADRWDGGRKREQLIRPSRFLADVPESLLLQPSGSVKPSAQDRGARAKRLGLMAPSSLSKSPQALPAHPLLQGSKPSQAPSEPAGTYMTRAPETMEELSSGAKVSHDKFGIGIILKRTGPHNNPKLHVQFDKWGKRTLLARMANLELVIT